ncbi:aminotransferase class I/II-fold pyridoxal phosphate-dependent enzyme [Actinophytocola sp. NPDC049390]|uniref:aminotransferase class I/II-fold pyridoxal phosphate-dependent enzyme n=1 Tax=Actinophytocola sp. NPDC049390 TaxID=3363894 RepID=UPI0037885696
MIEGATASEIVDSVRAQIDAGQLRAGEALPPVRALAAQLGVNRNTVSAAYLALARAGAVVSRGRAGTVVAGEPAPLGQEGFAAGTSLRDVGSGNPDPALLPDLGAALAGVRRAALYGDALIDPDLAAWATSWLEAAQPRGFRLSLAGGAVDAVERLLTQTLTAGDLVGLEEPCFLSSINAVRLAGYRPVAIPVDDEGMTVAGLEAAVAAGIRAVVCTPRAHNPTGASLSPRRAEQLRALLVAHPYLLVIEDDHFSMLSANAYHTVIAPEHRRWALVRSVSKFLGPDLRLAFVASDPVTAQRLGTRLSPGSTWVSHILQQAAFAMLSEPDSRALVDRAAAHYGERNRAAGELLAAQGVSARVGDGLNLWADTGCDAGSVSTALMRRGWLVRSGETFHVDADSDTPFVRLTLHDLDDDALGQFVADLADAIAEVQARTPAGRSS